MIVVAWLGLGAMGFPMAGHLSHLPGIEVKVFNRSPEKSAKWLAAYPGSLASTPANAADGADYVFACVGNDNDVREVTTGTAGAFAAMKPGAVFVDHTTASATVARDLALVAEKSGLAFLDAPVSGGEAGAKAGTLTVMVGGDAGALARAEPLIASYGRMIRRMGPSGSGQLAKMANQIAIAGLIQGLAEAITFAERAGLDIEALMSTISKGAAQSWQMENRWKTMHDRTFDFGFAVEWMRKDLAICADEADRNGANIAVTKLIDTYYAEIQNMGGNRWDTSSLIVRLNGKTSGDGSA